MPNPKTSSAILGAIELFLGRRAGLARFDMSVDGFWESFRAILFVLPFFAINVAVEHRMRLSDAVVDTVPDATFIAARVVDFGLDWVAMPLLLALLGKRLGIARGYAAYIVVRNWAQVIMAAPQALIALLLGVGAISLEISAVISLAVIAVMIRYHYRIIRCTLDKSIGFTIGLVVADMALSLILSEVIDKLFGL